MRYLVLLGLLALVPSSHSRTEMPWRALPPPPVSTEPLPEHLQAVARARKASARAFKRAHKAVPEIPPRVDLNSADVALLDQLPGIGPATAKRIVVARRRRPFRRPQDLMRVKGIGKATFKKLEDFVEVRALPNANRIPD